MPCETQNMFVEVSSTGILPIGMLFSSTTLQSCGWRHKRSRALRPLCVSNSRINLQ